MVFCSNRKKYVFLFCAVLEKNCYSHVVSFRDNYEALGLQSVEKHGVEVCYKMNLASDSELVFIFFCHQFISADIYLCQRAYIFALVRLLVCLLVCK